MIKVENDKITVSGTKEQVSNVIRGRIAEQYSLQDEIGILRKTLKAIMDKNKMDIPEEFATYFNTVESEIKEFKSY